MKAIQLLEAKKECLENALKQQFRELESLSTYIFKNIRELRDINHELVEAARVEDDDKVLKLLERLASLYEDPIIPMTAEEGQDIINTDAKADYKKAFPSKNKNKSNKPFVDNEDYDED